MKSLKVWLLGFVLSFLTGGIFLYSMYACFNFAAITSLGFNFLLCMAIPVFLVPYLMLILYRAIDKATLISLPISFIFLDIYVFIWSIYDYFSSSFLKGIVLIFILPMVFLGSIVCALEYWILKRKS